MISRLKGIAAAATLAIALSVTAAAPGIAQEISPEQLTLARKYVDLTNKAQIYEAVAAMTAQRTSQLLTQQNPELSTIIDETIGKVLTTRRGKSDELFNQIARLYAVTFTVEELQQIVTFYESPAGQKLADNSLSINQSTGQVMQIFTSNFGTEFVREVKLELRNLGHNV